MNIDSLPLTAFALEASGAAARAVGSAHTLTLKLAAETSGVTGGIVVRPVDGASSVSARARIPAVPLTLTF